MGLEPFLACSPSPPPCRLAQGVRFYACFIHLSNRSLHNFVTALADYAEYEAERPFLRLGPVEDVKAGKPAKWLDVCEQLLNRDSDDFPESAHVEHVCGCADVSAAAELLPSCPHFFM